MTLRISAIAMSLCTISSQQVLWTLREDFTDENSKLAVCVAYHEGTRTGSLQLLGEQPLVVHSLRDLVMRVNIDSAKTALQYVRLQTSPAEGSLIFSYLAAEVIPKSKLSSGFVFGNASILKLVSNRPSGYYGIVDDSELRGEPYHEPIVRRLGHIYVVNRIVLIRTLEGTFVVREVEEQIDERGGYQIVELKDIRWKKSTRTTFTMDNPL